MAHPCLGFYSGRDTGSHRNSDNSVCSKKGFIGMEVGVPEADTIEDTTLRRSLKEGWGRVTQAHVCLEPRAAGD